MTSPREISPRHDDPSYSVRRYHVDEFFARRVADLPAGALVLDLGGARIAKRGQFDIEGCDLRVIYANLSTAKRPHVCADAARAPFRSRVFDAVVCGELLEHVRHPDAVVREAFRLLRPGGRLLATAPFLFPIHGDPQDHGRYTDAYWRELLADCGFVESVIGKQGLFWEVLVDMVRALVWDRAKGGRPRWRWVGYLTSLALRWARRKAFEWDRRPAAKTNPFLSAYTTGFGICAKRPPISNDRTTEPTEGAP